VDPVHSQEARSREAGLGVEILTLLAHCTGHMYFAGSDVTTLPHYRQKKASLLITHAECISRIQVLKSKDNL